MNILHRLIETVLPYMISFLEIIGIFVVFWSALHGFWQYFRITFTKKRYDLQSRLAKGLALGLEFKMAAEILKTVLIQNMDELYVLGAVILLRALLSLLIHYEMRPHLASKKATEEKKAESADSEKKD